MAGLQRSAVSFRRQGSSGLVWDDRFLSGELNKLEKNDDKDQHHQPNLTTNRNGSIATVQRSRSSNAGYGTSAGRAVSPAIDPPSPKVSACGFCGAFGKTGDKKGQRSKPRNNKLRHNLPR